MSNPIKPLDVLKQGDIFWGEPDDTKGSEQSGRRKWIVMSRTALNGNNTVVVVPLTTKLEKSEKHPDFCIHLPEAEMTPTIGNAPSRESVALCHQVRVFDKSRFSEKWGKLSTSATYSVQLGIAYVFNNL
jgi:mRNA interferase MazF